MRTAAVLATSFLAAFLASCVPGASSDGPEDVVRTYLNALADQDCAAVKSVARLPDEVECDVVEGIELGPVDPDSAEYKLTEQEDSSAIVIVTYSDDVPEENYEVQQIDGDWKVVLDSAV